MKKHIILALSVASLLTFSACSDSDSGSGFVAVPSAVDIALAANQAATCSTASSFSVEPDGTPKVEFTTDAQNGDVTVKVINGTVKVKNCTLSI